MLFPGTRVGVIASSVKGPGPRYGSLGYVRNIFPLADGLPYTMVAYEHGTFALAATWAEIQFFRFGLEERSRCERKRVMCLLPMTSPHGETPHDTLSFLRQIFSQRPGLSPQVLNSLGIALMRLETKRMAGTRANSKYKIIIVPKPAGENIARCEEIHKQAWLEANLGSKMLMQPVRDVFTRNLPISVPVDSVILHTMLQCPMDRDLRSQTVRWALSNSENFEVLVRHVQELRRMAWSSFHGAVLARFDKNIEALANARIRFTRERFAGFVANGLFDPVMHKAKIKALSRLKPDLRAHALEVITQMQAIRHCLLERACEIS